MLDDLWWCEGQLQMKKISSWKKTACVFGSLGVAWAIPDTFSTWNKPDMSLWQSWSSMLLHWSSIKIHNPRFMLPFCNSQIQETKTLCHQTQSYIIWSSSSSSSSYGRNWKFKWRDSPVFKLTLPFCNSQIQESKTIHNKTWSYNCTSELKIQGRKKNHVSHDLTIVEACH